MARRPSRGRRTPTKTWVIVLQIGVLVALLIAIVQVRDSIAEGTSAIVGSLVGNDVEVREREAVEETDFPGDRTDAGAAPEAADAAGPRGDTGADSDTGVDANDAR